MLSAALASPALVCSRAAAPRPGHAWRLQVRQRRAQGWPAPGSQVKLLSWLLPPQDSHPMRLPDSFCRCPLQGHAGVPRQLTNPWQLQPPLPPRPPRPPKLGVLRQQQWRPLSALAPMRASSLMCPTMLLPCTLSQTGPGRRCPAAFAPLWASRHKVGTALHGAGAGAL